MHRRIRKDIENTDDDLRGNTRGISDLYVERRY